METPSGTICVNGLEISETYVEKVRNSVIIIYSVDRLFIKHYQPHVYSVFSLGRPRYHFSYDTICPCNGTLKNEKCVYEFDRALRMLKS